MTVKKNSYFIKAIRQLLFLVLMVNIGNIYAQYTAIPDACFERRLVDLGIDSDGLINGHVLTSDIATVTELNLFGEWEICLIHDLTGIEDFTALEIIDIERNQINYLDFSNNLNLKLINCTHCDVNSINVTQNTLLEGLYCRDNNIDIINISNNPNLIDIDVQSNNLQTIDISHNPQLKFFAITHNRISEVNFSNNLELESIFVGNNLISTIDVSLQPYLDFLSIQNNQISSIDVSNNLELSVFVCGNNQISNINVSNNLQLDLFWCQNNRIDYLDLSSNSLLSKFNCSNNDLVYLNVQNGNNSLLTGTFYYFQPYHYNRFIATNNPNLTCIYVDDAQYSEANWLEIDSNSHFVETETECNALSIDVFSLNEDIEIYPKPVKDILHIKSNKIINEISIYTLLGKKVLDFSAIRDESLNISSLNKGIYYVKIRIGSKFLKEKIIKI